MPTTRRARRAWQVSGGVIATDAAAFQIVGIQFTAFPRREGSFYLRAQENSNNGQEMSDDKFNISNPASGPFATLTGDPLPDTEEDGDFSVNS